MPEPPTSPADPLETAVLIAVSEFAEFTDRWRTVAYVESHPELSIAERFPPHVTVLAPWAADPTSPTSLDRLAAAVRSFAPFELSFTRACKFPGGVVWLRPEPHGLVTDLLRAVAAAFPEHPPYGGDHPEPRPHLTVSARGGSQVLDDVNATLAVEEPPRVLIDHVGVWVASMDGVWAEQARVPLGP